MAHRQGQPAGKLVPQDVGGGTASELLKWSNLVGDSTEEKQPWKAGDVPTHYTDEERRRLEESAAAHREQYPLGPAIAEAVTGVADKAVDVIWNVDQILKRSLHKLRKGVGNIAGQVDTALGNMGVEPAVPRNQPQALPPVDSPPMFQRQGPPPVTPPGGQTNMYGKMLDAANVGASVGMMSEGMAAIQAQRNNGRNTR